MRDITRTRKVLLDNWEEARQEMLNAKNKEEYLIRSGGLMAISSILNQLRHTGDGNKPIKAGEWTNAALQNCQQHPLVKE